MTIFKIIAVAMAVAGMVLGLAERLSPKPMLLATEQSPKENKWIGWIAWITATIGSLMLIYLRFFSN